MANLQTLPRLENTSSIKYPTESTLASTQNTFPKPQGISKSPTHPSQSRPLSIRSVQFINTWLSSYHLTCKDESSEASEQTHGGTLKSSSLATNDPSESNTSWETCEEYPKETTESFRVPRTFNVAELRSGSETSYGTHSSNSPDHAVKGADRLHVQHQKAPACSTSTRQENILEEGFDGEYCWDEGQSYQDFKENPAHEFWTWDQTKQQWYHQEDDAGSVIWCPTELD